MNRLGVLVLALAVLPAFAQLDTNSITVSASRSTSVQPDQVVFSVAVNSGMDAGLSDILAAVQSAGLTQANFSGVGTVQIYQVLSANTPTPAPMLEWDFTLPVPIAQLKATVTTLTNLQKTITQNNSGLTLSFQVAGTQVSPQLQQSQTCSMTDLLTDARAQAQKIASAAGVILGDVLAMSSSTANNAGPISAFISTSRFSSTSSYSLPAACSLMVKFGMSKY